MSTAEMTCLALPRCSSLTYDEHNHSLLCLFFIFSSLLTVGPQTSFLPLTVLEFVNAMLLSQLKQFSVLLWTSSIGLTILPKLI